VRYRRAHGVAAPAAAAALQRVPRGHPLPGGHARRLLPHLKADKRLQALDVEMEYMFSTWFDVGFLELRRISWDSPASLIEKLIKYEAVHDIAAGPM
jgi:malonyl-CoA decarboxylase